MQNNKDILKAVELIAKLSIDRSSSAFSKMIKSGAKIELDEMVSSSLTEISEQAILTENEEVVAAFIHLEGETPFKFLFYSTINDSLILTDLILGNVVGTTSEFNEDAKSAVQELGNLLASCVSNVFSKDFNTQLLPTPPKVLCEIASIIFQQFLMCDGEESDSILLIKTIFKVVRHDLKCKMFLIPKGNCEELMQFIN